MANLQWRRFNFFEKNVDILNTYKIESHLVASQRYENNLILCDSTGKIYFSNKNGTTLNKAYSQTITLVKIVGDFMITVGHDNGCSYPIIKIWNLKQIFVNKKVFSLRSVKVVFPNSPNIYSICMHRNMLYLFVGLTSGQIIFYRANFAVFDKEGLPLKPQLFYDANRSSAITNMFMVHKTSYRMVKKFTPATANDKAIMTVSAKNFFVTSDIASVSKGLPVNKTTKTVVWVRKRIGVTHLCVTTISSILTFTFQDANLNVVYASKVLEPVFKQFVTLNVLNDVMGCDPECACICRLPSGSTLNPNSSTSTILNNLSNNPYSTDLTKSIVLENSGGIKGATSKFSTGSQNNHTSHTSSPSEALYQDYFVVAKQEAIYFYTMEFLGPCLAFESTKLVIKSFGNYLILITDAVDLSNEPSEPQKSTYNLASIFNENSGIEGFITYLKRPKNVILTIYDIVNKIIAFSSPIPAFENLLLPYRHNNTFSLSAMNQQNLIINKNSKRLENSFDVQNISKNNSMTPSSIWILTCTNFASQASSSYNLIELYERSLETKLEIVVQKNLYSLAINMVNNYNENANQFVGEIRSSNQINDNAATLCGNNYNVAVSSSSNNIMFQIYKLYGDYLYDKGDFYGAIKQYIKTISFNGIEQDEKSDGTVCLRLNTVLEPSYLLLKYMKSPKQIKALSPFIEAYVLWILNAIYVKYTQYKCNQLVGNNVPKNEKIIKNSNRIIIPEEENLVLEAIELDEKNMNVTQKKGQNQKTTLASIMFTLDTYLVGSVVQCLTFLTNFYIKYNEAIQDSESHMEKLITTICTLKENLEDSITLSNFFHDLVILITQRLYERSEPTFREKAGQLASMYDMSHIYLTTLFGQEKFNEIIAYVRGIIQRCKNPLTNELQHYNLIQKLENIFNLLLFTSEGECIYQLLRWSPIETLELLILPFKSNNNNNNSQTTSNIIESKLHATLLQFMCHDLIQHLNNSQSNVKTPTEEKFKNNHNTIESMTLIYEKLFTFLEDLAYNYSLLFSTKEMSSTQNFFNLKSSIVESDFSDLVIVDNNNDNKRSFICKNLTLIAQTLLEYYILELPNAWHDSLLLEGYKTRIRNILYQRKLGPTPVYNPETIMTLIQRCWNMLSSTATNSMLLNDNQYAAFNGDHLKLNICAFLREILTYLINLKDDVHQSNVDSNRFATIKNFSTDNEWTDEMVTLWLQRALQDFEFGSLNNDITDLFKLFQSSPVGTRIPIDAVKPYLRQYYDTQSKNLNELTIAIEKLRENIHKNEEMINDLTNNPQTFTQTKCHACQHSLSDSTSIYFFACQHAFHVNCFDTYDQYIQFQHPKTIKTTNNHFPSSQAVQIISNDNIKDIHASSMGNDMTSLKYNPIIMAKFMETPYLSSSLQKYNNPSPIDEERILNALPNISNPFTLHNVKRVGPPINSSLCPVCLNTNEEYKNYQKSSHLQHTIGQGTDNDKFLEKINMIGKLFNKPLSETSNSKNFETIFALLSDSLAKDGLTKLTMKTHSKNESEANPFPLD